MIFLSQLERGEQGEIVRINADKVLRDRFASFGLLPGETVRVQECSLARQTFEVVVGTTTVALRKEEAERIEICRLS